MGEPALTTGSVRAPGGAEPGPCCCAASSRLAAVYMPGGFSLIPARTLFPFTIVGGFTVQLVLSRTHHEHLVERRTVNDITGLSLGILIAAAIGTLSLSTLGANIPSVLILTALSVPLIIGIGSLTFGIASAAATAGLIMWGVVRNRGTD